MLLLPSHLSGERFPVRFFALLEAVVVERFVMLREEIVSLLGEWPVDLELEEFYSLGFAQVASVWKESRSWKEWVEAQFVDWMRAQPEGVALLSFSGTEDELECLSQHAPGE